jgi:rare lipoprotein A
MPMRSTLGVALAVLLLAGCASSPRKAPQQAATHAAGATAADAARGSPYPAVTEDASKRGDYTAGGLYAPGVADSTPADLADVDRIPEPVPDAEPRSRYGNRDYSVLGKRYHVMDSAAGYHEIGQASYYGGKFHRRRTSSLEVYDMYAFTAAHRTLPLPSFVRVTNLDNGKSVVVRVNDRGPFHSRRIIDLSYAAAVKLGMVKQGVARVEVVALQAGDNGNGKDGDDVATAARGASAPTASSPASPPASPPPATPSAMDRWLQERPLALRESPRAALAVGTGATAGVPAAAATHATPDPLAVLPTNDRPAASRARPDARPTTPDGTEVASGAAMPSAVMTAAAAPQSAAAQAMPPTGETWQLASYRERAIAEHALQRLQSAGIADARLEAAQAADGSPRWRLRLGPVPARTAAETRARAELRGRIAGLGFTPMLIGDDE